MKKMICAMAALTMLATACKDKGEQFEINGRIAEADGKKTSCGRYLYGCD